MKDFDRLKDKIEKAANLIVVLKKDKEKLIRDNDKLNENLKFYEKENLSAKKLIEQNKHLNKDKKVVRERLEGLLNRLEKMNV